MKAGTPATVKLKSGHNVSLLKFRMSPVMTRTSPKSSIDRPA